MQSIKFVWLSFVILLSVSGYTSLNISLSFDEDDMSNSNIMSELEFRRWFENFDQHSNTKLGEIIFPDKRCEIRKRVNHPLKNNFMYWISVKKTCEMVEYNCFYHSYFGINFETTNGMEDDENGEITKSRILTKQCSPHCHFDKSKNICVTNFNSKDFFTMLD